MCVSVCESLRVCLFVWAVELFFVCIYVYAVMPESRPWLIAGTLRPRTASSLNATWHIKCLQQMILSKMNLSRNIHSFIWQHLAPL